MTNDERRVLALLVLNTFGTSTTGTGIGPLDPDFRRQREQARQWAAEVLSKPPLETRA